MKSLFHGLARKAGTMCSDARPAICPLIPSNPVPGNILCGSISQLARAKSMMRGSVRSAPSTRTAFYSTGGRIGQQRCLESANKMRRPIPVRFGSSWELHPGHGRPSTEECALILSAAAHKLDVLDEASVKQFASQLSERANHTLFKILLEQDRKEGLSKLNLEICKKLDKNNDGKISKEELVQAVKEAEDQPLEAPTYRQLMLVMATSSVPFIGFGFMDNSIMILAGEAIEVNLGHAFSLTTMGAAATGNMISDVAGVGLGSYIESIARRSGFTSGHGLSPEQMEMKATRLAGSMGAAFGVSLGCILGMFPLLFWPGDHGAHEAAPKAN